MSTQSQHAYSRDYKMQSPEGGHESDSNPEFVNVGTAINNGSLNQRFDRQDVASVKAKSTGPFIQAPGGGSDQYQQY